MLFRLCDQLDIVTASHCPDDLIRYKVRKQVESIDRHQLLSHDVVRVLACPIFLECMQVSGVQHGRILVDAEDLHTCAGKCRHY